MPYVVEPTRRLPRWALPVAGALVVFGVIGSIVAYKLMHEHEAFLKMRQQALTLSANRKYDEGAKLAESYYNEAWLRDNKAETADVLGIIYLSKHDNVKTKFWFEREISLSSSSNIVPIQGLMESARSTGDKASEIKYTNMAIELMKKNDKSPLSGGIIRSYQNRVAELKGSK